MTTIAEELQIIRLTTGRDILLDSPQECEEMLAQARSEGIEVSRLYVLSTPLGLYKGGSFLRRDRSMWIHYDRSHPDGLNRALRYELHELAHAENPPVDYTSIDQDWDEEERTWKRAVQLACDWGWERLFPAGYLEERLAELEVLREHHWSAGYLLGSLSPSLARVAYDALCDVRVQEGWDLSFFGAALGGWSKDPLANARVLDFDRSLLRSWRVPYQRGGAFGSMRLHSTERSDSLLRTTLRAVAEHPLALTQLNWQKSRGTDLCFIQVEEEQDFCLAIGALNGLLLDGAPASVLATWHCYGDSTRDRTPPLYRLAVHASDDTNGLEALDPPVVQPSPARASEREAWILFSGSRSRALIFEAALQRYIASWLAWQSLQQESARDGLSLLWGWLK